MTEKQADILNKQFTGKEAQETLRWFLSDYGGNIVFSTGLGMEDQVITHMIAEINPKTKIFTLDTGRLFQETYDLLDLTNKKYNINIEVFFPDTEKVELMVKDKGINLFYESFENRKFCCHIRKIEPLHRALKNRDAWICGLRNEQSSSRQNTKVVEWDEQNGLLKINPLIHWSEAEVWDFIRQHNIPYNKLHDKGFPSIGCSPCTRAIKPGEDSRSGRWWWEMDGKKECGLHLK